MEIALSAAPGYVRFEVSDTGQGIDAAFLPHVFDIFRKADGASSVRSKGGLGIGLALVKQLTQAHEGRDEVVSAGAGKGTTFTVVLPRAATGETAGMPPTSPLQGVRLVLVDDQPDAGDRDGRWA